MTPKRVQLKRTKGWRMPENAVRVSRPGPWGNPFPIAGDWIMWTAVAFGYRADAVGRRACAVELHRAWITETPVRRNPEARSSPGAIQYDNGEVVSLDDLTRGFAAFGALTSDAPTLPDRPDIEPLRGFDLACWCKPDDACHADVLLELANANP